MVNDTLLIKHAGSWWRSRYSLLQSGTASNSNASPNSQPDIFPLLRFSLSSKTSIILRPRSVTTPAMGRHRRDYAQTEYSNQLRTTEIGGHCR